ncbi:unnamed protein product, partial [Polarella glacialis]
VARTVIAPVERVKIIFQTSKNVPDSGVFAIIRKVAGESGGGLRTVTAFWKGNSVAVIRVFPYLGVQLSSNEYFRNHMKVLCSNGSGAPSLNVEAQRFLAG